MKKHILGSRAARWLAVGSVTLTLIAADAGWQPLFNGRNLDGWRAWNDVTFEAQDGVIHLVRGMGWLGTERSFQDFVFEFECRPLVEKYDSGIYFRAGLEGKPWPTGGWQVNLRYNMFGGLVKGYQAKDRTSAPPVAVGEWAKFRLTVQGTKAMLEVNGKKVWEYDQIDSPEGYLGIQAEDRAFEFRNLRIREL
jgi:hypothetical protein